LSEATPGEDLLDLYENAPCGYASLAPDGRLVKINGTLAGWLNTDADLLVGRSIRDLLSFGGRIAYETHLAPMLRLQGRVDEIAFDLLLSDGSKLPVIANATERRGHAGEHLFTRLTIFKAVDRRTYERGLVEARARAEASARDEHETSVLREQFIAVLGHDLRNPLAALAAGVGLLNDREPLSDPGRLIVREMGGSIARASALIENVLDFARGRLGEGITLARDAHEPLTPVLEQVVGEMRAIAPDRAIVTAFTISKPVDCDRARIAQLASNLLANAVTHGAPSLPIQVAATTRDGNLILSVANGGMPISEEARARLFQPFFRGAVRHSQQGLGLGLFIVSEIAHAHGGVMSVTSSDEETRFTFTMPLEAFHP
jgi:sigma-B regulation protein RsbU (phosphoserine phosphatase)